MPFSDKIKADALTRSGRHCCLCHKHIGVNVEVHHIIQEAKGGTNTLDNAIVLCFDCHATVGHYNPDHPRGNKYKPEELRKQRDFWWSWYATYAGKPLPNEAITVSPTLIQFWSNHHRQQNMLYVHNTSNDLYYTVLISLTAIPAQFSLKDVRVEVVSSNQEGIFHRVGPLEVMIDNLTWQSENGLTLMIASLEPDERRKYRITNTMPGEIGSLVQPQAKIEVGWASFEPMQVFSQY